MAKWSGKTRGNALGYSIFIFSIKFFGLPVGYFILRFVSLYFYFFVPEKKGFIEDFYLNYVKLDKSIVQLTIRKNFYQLGQSLLDKIAFSVGKGGRIKYVEKGEHYLSQLSASGKGAFLFSGHVGNWDIAGNLLKGIGANVSVVMYQNEQEEIQKLLDKEGSVPKFNIIPIGEDFSHLLKIYSAIKRGDLVCMHADRYLEGAKTESIPFLGKPANFPIAPFQLVEKLKVPYSFVFAVKEKNYLYSFSATKPVIEPRKAGEIAGDFVLLLEEKVRAHPEQWYNYFSFHDKE